MITVMELGLGVRFYSITAIVLLHPSLRTGFSSVTCGGKNTGIYFLPRLMSTNTSEMTYTQ